MQPTTVVSNEHSFAAQQTLMRSLKKVERLKKLKAFVLVLPLLLFLVLVFIFPLINLLKKSVDNSEFYNAIPNTAEVIAQWNGKGLPSEEVMRAFVDDLIEANKNTTIAEISKRLNGDLPGYRSLINKTNRRLLTTETIDNAHDFLLNLDARWSEPQYWQILQRNANSTTSAYFIAALDLKRSEDGSIVRVSAEEVVYLDVFLRTFWIAFMVSIICLILAYPVAYLLAILPTSKSNLLIILVLLPFWTSLLVRMAAWIVLLQQEGLINNSLLFFNIVEEPLKLVFNRTGVYISMVHILIPFMILPIYSVMKGISPAYVRAAVSLGCHPIKAFFKVYVPLTINGVGSGFLLVFIMSLGYYITPALVGSPNDQMVSYFIAFFTNTTINWGMASALGSLLLIATMILYSIYYRLAGAGGLKMR